MRRDDPVEQFRGGSADPPVADLAGRQRLIAVVDDDEEVAESHAGLLRALGHRTLVITDSRQVAELLLRNSGVELALLDIRMPHIDGLDVLARLSCTRPDIGVIMATVVSDIEFAVRATKSGAFNYLLKPLSLERLRSVIDSYFLSRAQPPLGDPRFSGFVTQSPQFEPLFRRLLSFAEVDVTVLIEGETGTGKEVIARLIHACSPRAGKPFVALNLAAIPDDLMEAELFGHVRGSFTGAISTRKGLFEEVEEGTLFIDEFGEASREIQKKLLRVLQERTFRPVGGSQDRTLRARVIVATNRMLSDQVAAGDFRADLYFRVAAHNVRLPPLRERREDIALLANYFVKKYCSQYGRNIVGIHPATLRHLEAHSFPGNVRELEGMMSAAVLLEQCAMLMPSSLPESVMRSSTGDSEDDLTSNRTRRILQVLTECRGNQTAAARRLGMSRETLNRILKRYRDEIADPKDPLPCAPE